ncbi:MAG TPA: uroporphyrinogen-III synthase [Bacteroidota bacterium]|nr:uroporphyrinogen-III synthase [Bacteroidota bacterium]
MGQMPLEGKTVVVTRPKHQAGAFADLLQTRGAHVLFFPAIEITPPVDWSPVDEAIETIRGYDALVFTSSNAARYFFERARDRGLTSVALGKKVVYALGAKTAEAVAFYGMRAVRFPGVGNANELGSAIVNSGVRHRRYLLPKGRLAGTTVRDTLVQNGQAADEIVVYETVMPRADETREMRQALESSRVDVVTFFSPSSVENYFTLVGDIPLGDKTVFAAIGKTTAEALRAIGKRAEIVAGHPKAEELVAAIERYFADALHDPLPPRE